MPSASDQKLRAFLEAAPQAIIAMTRDGRIVMVNSRTEEMFGRTRLDLLSRPVTDLMPERFRDAHSAAYERFFELPAPRTLGGAGELMGLRADGSEFPVEISVSFVDQPEGALALALVSDITAGTRTREALARANNELRIHEAQLTSFLEAAPQAIVAVDAQGRIGLVNRATEEMFGYERGELLGQPLSLLIPERYREAHQGHRERFFTDPRRRTMGKGLSLAGRRRNGTEFPVEVGLSYVDMPAEDGQWDGLRMAIGMVSDITERKRYEDELARVNEELRRSNLELEHFGYAASHDLQEPLRLITNYLQLLERRLADRLDGSEREFLHYTTDAAARMKTLIQDLLRLSRAGRQELKLNPVEASTVFETARGSLLLAIEESGAEITADELPEIVADAGLLAQVLQNLMANAIKFQETGSRPEVHVSARREGPDWVFAVRDNGIGIDERHGERIFQMFERLHGIEEYAGSGVGLAIAKRIVERHGGRIWVEPAPGHGSVFLFTVPVHIRREPSGATSAARG